MLVVLVVNGKDLAFHLQLGQIQFLVVQQHQVVVMVDKILLHQVQVVQVAVVMEALVHLVTLVHILP